MMISQETATDIAYAYREIDVAEKLLEQIVEALARHENPECRDAFGRRAGGLQLGVPSGGGHRLFDVPWSLAKPVIEAHVAYHKSKIAALTEKARAELGEAI